MSWLKWASRFRRGVAASAVSLIVCLMLGCGGDDGPELGTVSGTVTLDGKPLPNAGIIFDPKGEGSFSMAKTDESGHYELKYSFDEDGAIPGEHEVRITTGDESGDKLIPEQVPAQYNHLTELVETVKPGHNEINFELKSDGRILQPNESEKIEMLKYRAGR